MHNDFKNIKAVIFDYDGTLSKRYISAYEVYKIIFKEIDETFKNDELELERIVQAAMYPDQFGARPKDLIFNEIKDRFYPNLDVDYCISRFYELEMKHQCLSDDCVETINKLKEKYKVGILTNGRQISQCTKIIEAGINDLFDVVIATGEYGINKPEKQIFEIMASKLGVKPEECVFIGDTFQTDIYGALKANMKVIWYEYEKKMVNDLNILKAFSFKELQTLLLD